MIEPQLAAAISLVAAHILGDFLLQTKSDTERKDEPAIVIKHAATVAFVSYLAAGFWTAWFIPASIFLSHALADPVKFKLNRSESAGRTKQIVLFLADQAVHLAVIGFLVFLIGLEWFSGRMFWTEQFGNGYLDMLIWVSGAILITRVGGMLIGMAVRPYTDELVSKSIVDGPQGRGFAEGGKVIGYLERFLILMFILFEFPVGIGFLIAAKSVFRFGEVSDPGKRMEAEYIIIGTFMSFSYAIAVGYGVRYVFSLV